MTRFAIHKNPDALITAFLAKGLLGNAQILSKVEVDRLGAIAGVQGLRTTKRGRLTLRLTVDASFPTSLPKVYLVPSDALGFRPHVDKRGVICWQDDSTSLVDFASPLQVLEQAIVEAAAIVECEYSPEQETAEFAEEFPSYWRDHAPNLNAFSCVKLSETPRHISFRVRDKQYSWFEDESIGEFFRHQDQPKGQVRKALFVPLARPIRPPAFNKFWSDTELLSILSNNCSPQALSFLKSEGLKEGRLRGEYFLLLAFPNPKGGHHALGLKLTSNGREHPFSSGAHFSLAAIGITRVDQEYLLPRGGANSGLFSRKVCVIGAGSLGGQVVNLLAQLGVGHITIVDHDKLNSENFFRHVLGIEAESTLKVEALKQAIEKRLPYVKIQAEPRRIEEVIERKKDFFEQFDVVISTIGLPSVNRWINNFVIEHLSAIPVVYAWLEPLGIGGHVLVTNNRGKACCLECLFDQATLYNRASFAAEKNPPFSKTYLGCSGRFVPFSFLDSDRTAELTVRTAARLLRNQEKGNPLYSWKGDDADFRAEGYNPSDRYLNLSSDELWARRYDYKSGSCPICG